MGFSMRRFSPALRGQSLPARRWMIGLLLVIYGIGNSCLPAGPAALKFGCRCDKILQEANNCCCLKKAAASSERACCRKQKPVASSSGSCCQSHRSATRACRDGASVPLAISACSCDSPQDAGYLLNTDPRVLTACPVLKSEGEIAWQPLLTARIPAGQSLTPELPPPRSVLG